MNPTRSKTVFEEREELRVQLLSTQNMLVAEQRHTRRLGAQLTAVEELLRGLTAELQATRKVADAEAANDIARSACHRVYVLWQSRVEDGLDPSESDMEAHTVLINASDYAYEALRETVREYRALTEPSQPKKVNHA